MGIESNEITKKPKVTHHDCKLQVFIFCLFVARFLFFGRGFPQNEITCTYPDYTQFTYKKKLRFFFFAAGLSV